MRHLRLEQRHLAREERRTHLLGVAAAAVRLLLVAQREEARAQALHLLLALLPRVEAPHIAAQPARGGCAVAQPPPHPRVRVTSFPSGV